MFVIEFRGNRSCAQCTPSELLSMAQFCDSLKLVSLCALDWHNVEWLLFRADRSLATVTEKPPTKLVKDENWTTNQPKYKDILLLICFQSRLWIRKIQCTFTMSSIRQGSSTYLEMSMVSFCIGSKRIVTNVFHRGYIERNTIFVATLQNSIQIGKMFSLLEKYCKP